MNKPQPVEHALSQVPVKISTCCCPNLTSILNIKGSEPDGFGMPLLHSRTKNCSAEVLFALNKQANKNLCFFNLN